MSNASQLTDEQKKVLDHYSNTGNDLEGKKVKNLFTFARENNTSVAIISLYLRGFLNQSR